MTRHRSIYELRGGSGLANWLEFVLLTKRSALLQAGQRCYEVVRVAPALSKGRITPPNEGRHMKKPSTQIRDIVQSRLNPDGTASLTAEDVTAIDKLTASLDRRDQQYRVGKKPKPAAKHAAKKAAKKAARR